MIRILAILMLILAGAPGLGAVGVRGGFAGSCEETACQHVVVRTTCCSETIETMPCHTGEDDCTCGVAPMPDRQPQPQAPLPRTERDSPAAAPAERPALVGAAAWDAKAPRSPIAAPDQFTALTNNEVQALMGVWRT
ncbi:MAG: hypothetical protein Q9O74_04035 [Planctomycetota bacterium]|nr:hypothetical protein [Planctomycetota bacterium]